MTEELIAALEARIKEGDTKDVLRKEVLAAGYELPEFQASYAEAAKRVGVTNEPIASDFTASTPADVLQVPTEQPVVQSEPVLEKVPTPEAPAVEPAALEAAPIPGAVEPEVAVDGGLSKPHEVKPAVIFSIIAGLIFLTLVTFAALAFTSPFKMTSFMKGLFGGAPYTEETMLQDIALGVASIDSAGFKVSLSVEAVEKDGDTYLLPEELALEDMSDMSQVFAMVPKDFNVYGAISGDFDISHEGSTNAYTQIEGSYETDDFSVNVDVEMIAMQEEGVFVRINRMPSLFFFDFSELKGNWLHIFTHALENSDIEEFREEVSGADDEDLEQFKYIFEQIQKHKLLVLEGEPVEEEVNGEMAYKYTLVLNQAGIKQFFDETMSGLESKYGPYHALSDFDDEFDLDRFTSAAYISYFNTHNKIVLWGRPDGIPARVGIESRIAIDDDATGPFEEARKQGMDATKMARLSSLRAKAELYYDDNEMTYNSFCSSDNFMWFDESWEYSCADTSNDPSYVDEDGFTSAYAVDIELSDGRLFCVDSTGFAEEGYEVDEYACVKDNETGEPEMEEVPREAERQVNVSFYVDLINVNEPATITVPAGALSPEEIAENDPMIGMGIVEMNEGYEGRDNGSSSDVPGVPSVPVVRGIQFMKDQITNEVTEVPMDTGEIEMAEEVN